MKQFKTHPSVPDGIYDDLERLVRYEIVNEMYVRAITAMWVLKGGSAADPDLSIEPWGHYPDIPRKT